MKKIVSIILTIVMLLSIIPFGSTSISAATNGVQSKISEIVAKYPTGSYFSVNGKACTHGQLVTCNNCRLSNICPEATKVCTNAYTCLAFARYVFWYIFGLNPEPVGQSFKWAAFDNINSIAKPGDFITFYNSSGNYYHAAIYLGASSNGFYTYTSNYGEANKVKYNREITSYEPYATDSNGNPYPKKFAESKYKVFHASNYDSIANVIPKLTIKYHANGGYIKSEKADEIFIDSKGLMLKYSTNDYYANNWQYGTSYSNGLINASSFGVVKDGYKFVGWSLSKSGGTVYDQTTARKPEDIYPDLKNGSATITMYAVWEPYVLTIKYRHNGYIKEEKSSSYYLDDEGYIRKVSTDELHTNSWKYGTTYKNGLIDNTTFGIAFDGYKFLKWAYVKSDETVSYYDVTTSRKPEQIYPDLKNGNATITMIPYWEPNKLKVVCNANGGTVTSSKYYADSDDMIFNHSTNEPFSIYWYYGKPRENGFTDDTTFGLKKNCHEFVGWSIAKENSEVYDDTTAYNAETIYPDIKNGDATATFYAIWKETSHTFGNSCDKVCNICGDIREITHKYKDAVTKATTSKNGKVVKTCSVCGDVESTKTVYYAKSFSLSTTPYTYNGKAKTPSVTVKDYKGNKLKKDVDYTVSYPSGRTNVGEYKVKVTLKGNYTGTKTLTFKINAVKSSKLKLKLSTTSYTYNGKTRKPTVTVKDSSGKTVSSKYYTVTYPSGRKYVGSYKVKIKFKGNYTGTEYLTFKINPKATTVSKLTAAKKSLKVSIKKQSSQTTGYQVQYSTSKKFTNATTKTVKSYKTTSYTIKSLKAKKTYYVRVRTYKTVNGKKYYSAWSSYKYKKTK